MLLSPGFHNRRKSEVSTERDVDVDGALCSRHARQEVNLEGKTKFRQKENFNVQHLHRDPGDLAQFQGGSVDTRSHKSALRCPTSALAVLKASRS